MSMRWGSKEFKFSFDMIYLKITEPSRSVTGDNK